MSKTLYLWDVANTLFLEKWNKELTGFNSYEDYVVAQGVGLKDARGFENCYHKPYVNGEMFSLSIADGFKEVLSWTKNNEIFTTGNREQMDWRAEYLNPKVGFDIRSFFQKINSTFDYGETNIKTKEMLVDYLGKKYAKGFGTVVYTDDKLSNCEFFKQAAGEMEALHPDFTFRIYNILNDNSGVSDRGWYFTVGNLFDLKNNEETLQGREA